MAPSGGPPPLQPQPAGAPRILLPKKEPGSSPSATLGQIPDHAPKKRKCISMACMPCRTRKSKCDGKQPACSACVTVYSTDCIYDIDSDRRRKGALKRDIKHLMEDNERRDIILEALKNASDVEVDDIVNLIRSDRNYEAIADVLENMHLNATRNSSERSTLEGELSDFVGKPSLSKNGETRHYGHTSNLTILGTSDEIRSNSPVQPTTWTNVTSDFDLIKHLFNLYFAWSHPFYLLFSQETFFYGMRERKSKYCTPLLVNAICSIGCHLSDRPEARADPNDPSTAGDHFFAEAKRLLWEESDSSLTTVQALGVMSIRAAMASEDNLGWKYAGQMMTMSVELGLHMSYNANGRLTPTEVETRRITFWGCYVLQTAWSICVGRISFLPQAAITLEKPVLRDNLESAEWKPYDDPKQDELVQPGHPYNVLLQIARLSEIVNEIVHMFYAPQGRTNSRKLLNLYSRLQEWYEALPECLQIQPKGCPTIAQVIALHMYYHNCVLHLFRPFLRVNFVQTAKSPHQVCTEAARTITQLVTLYSQTYGLRRVCLIILHNSMTAGVQHLVDLQSPQRDIAARAETDLVVIIKAIYGIASASPLADRFLKILLDLIRRWAITLPDKVQQAMQEAEMGSVPNDPQPPTPHQLLSNSSTSTGTQQAQQASKPQIQPPHLSRQPSSPNLIPTKLLPTLSMPPALPPTLPPQSNPHSPIHQSESHVNHQPQTQAQENHNPFWTPFPDSFEGVPVAYPTPETYNPYMDISAMLSSGVPGDWAQLNRDGFTMANSNSGVRKTDPSFSRWTEG